MSNLVVYHNDFNKVKLPNFTELEQNLLFAIISKISNNKMENNRIFISIEEIDAMLGLNYRFSLDNKFTMLETLQHKFFNADFTILENKTTIHNNVQKEIIEKRKIHLFNEMGIRYEMDTLKMNPYELLDTLDPTITPNSKKITSIIGIEFEINEKFSYLVIDLIKNFTLFDLKEFISISGKYTKTLYRLLKQFRTQGWFEIDWQEFCYVMDIPKSYKMSDINKQILNPAIVELTRERTLFDNDKENKFQSFKNLTIIKKRGKGRGGRISAIRFEFDRFYTPQQIEAQKEFKILTQPRSSIVFDGEFIIEDKHISREYLHRKFWMVDNKFEDRFNNHKIISVKYNATNGNIIIYTENIDDKYRGKPFVFNSMEHANNFLKNYEIVD